MEGQGKWGGHGVRPPAPLQSCPAEPSREEIISVNQGLLPPFVKTCLLSFLNITVNTPSWHCLGPLPFHPDIIKN